MLTDWASKLGTQPQPGPVAVAGSPGGFSGAWTELSQLCLQWSFLWSGDLSLGWGTIPQLLVAPDLTALVWTWDRLWVPGAKVGHGHHLLGPPYPGCVPEASVWV